VKHNGFCENEQLRGLFPALGNVAIVSLLHYSKLAELPQCRRISWRRRGPGQEGNSSGGARFPPCSYGRRMTLLEDLKKAAEN
jgi:hypothetical protein